MRYRYLGLLAPTLVALLAVPLLAKEPSKKPDKKPARVPEGPSLPGFVYVPAGKIQPGCTSDDYKRRATNGNLKRALLYDKWGAVPALSLPAYHVGRFEITNAQWKHYMDRNFRVEHVCDGSETLETLAEKYVRFRGRGVASEWRAIYAMNWKKLVAAWKNPGAAQPKKPEAKPEEKKSEEEEKPDKAEPKKKNAGKKKPAKKKRGKKKNGKKPKKKKNGDEAEEGGEQTDGDAAKKAEEPAKPLPVQWKPDWSPEDPPHNAKVPAKNAAKFRLPKGLKLTLYRHRVPQTWYGWCRLSGLRVGREYFDPTLSPAEAFTVPDEAILKNLRPPMRSQDFASFPVRDVSPNEMFAFAEWAGCHLPSEYEFERAGRPDRPNTEQHTIPGPWNHAAQWERYSFGGNEKVIGQGPARVDDPAFAGGDTKSGVRHLLGNVWEMTRTFYDLHPHVRPKLPTPDPDLTNYALTAKGASYGDGWRFVQLSTRSAKIGDAVLDLKYQNRADTLGLRLVRHVKPGWDLMSHSLFRLCYGRGNTTWLKNPIGFAMPRASGIDVIHITPAKAPYVHAREKAMGIAFVPTWMTDLNQKVKDSVDKRWKRGGKNLDGSEFQILGALRSDVAIRAGVRMSAAEAVALKKQRKEYAEAVKRRKQASKKKKKEIKLPPKPPEPDAFEIATRKKQAEIGLWREKTLPPGEWIVVYWYGYIGLANKAGIMPPEGIFMLDKKSVKRVRKPENMATTVTADAEKDRVTIRFVVEEQPVNLKKRQSPPGEAKSELWAACRILPNGWIGRRRSDFSYDFRFDLPVAKGALGRHNWNKGGE